MKFTFSANSHAFYIIPSQDLNPSKDGVFHTTVYQGRMVSSQTQLEIGTATWYD